MTQPLYLQPQEVAAIPGRFRQLWNSLADPSNDATLYIEATDTAAPVLPTEFSDEQLMLLEEASAVIDEATAQHGGLLLQTDKQIRRRQRANSDTILLPNKPIASVSQVTIRRGAVTFNLDLTNNAVELSDGQAVTYNPYAPFQSGVVPSGLMASTYDLDGHITPFSDGDVITITYTCGYAAEDLPVAIRDAARRILQEALFSFIENPRGATETRSGRNLTRQGSESYVNAVDIRTRRALTPYRCIKTG